MMQRMREIKEELKELYNHATRNIEEVNPEPVSLLSSGVFYRLDPKRRQTLKTIYRDLKKYGFRAMVGSVGIKDTLILLRDMSLNQVKKFGLQFSSR